nr:hypothetical protein CFP56_49030 [Quercus suber]
MSKASSNQSFVRDGVGYDEVYSLGHKNPDVSNEDRTPSATSPSINEGIEMDGSRGDLNDDDMAPGDRESAPQVQTIEGDARQSENVPEIDENSPLP